MNWLLIQLTESGVFTHAHYYPGRREQEWWGKKREKENHSDAIWSNVRLVFILEWSLGDVSFTSPWISVKLKVRAFFECLQIMLLGHLKKKKEQIFHSATMPAFAGVHAFQTAEILLSRRTAAGGVAGWNDGVREWKGCSGSHTGFWIKSSDSQELW